MTKWIRRKILDDILAAVNETGDRRTYVFYITSKGGEGKTVLLRQIGMALDSPDGIAAKAPWTGVLDLYHSDINSNSGLEKRLSQAIETANEFANYRNERELNAARRQAGLIGADIEAERSKMARLFAECFNQVSQWMRPVIALDTTERIQYEVDEIQKICGIESESTTVRDWLTIQLRLWQNCVVLLVGRPEMPGESYLGKALSDALATISNVCYREMTLGGFDADESRDYFEQAVSNDPHLRDILDEKFCERLRMATHGSPIRMELAVEIIRNGYELDKFCRDVESGTLAEIHQEIDSLLVRYLLEQEPDPASKKVLRYLAVARKGLDAALIFYLAEGRESDENDGDRAKLQNWQHCLETVAERFYIKRHPEEQRIFLHDEMYQFCDTHWLRPEEAQRISQQIAGWYDKKIRSADDEREKRELQIESIFYRLRADSVRGYHWYVQVAEFAIRSAETGFDLRLRNEVIAFFKSSSPIDQGFLQNTPDLLMEFKRDSGANWVKRLSIRGENIRAIRVAKQLSDLGFDLYDDTISSQFSQADLDVFHAQALIYTGQIPDAFPILNRVLSKLEGGAQPEEVAQFKDTDYLMWRRNLILGRAHNNLGYAQWTALWHLNAAIHEFSKALPYFNVSQLKEELANTCDNNARVHAILRQQTHAETLVNEGLLLRQQLKREYRIALSLISKATVNLEFDKPNIGERLSRQALDICKSLGTLRGEGLAAIVLCRSLRRLTKLRSDGVYSTAECQAMLSEAAQVAERAKSIFSESVREPVRLIEANNELGCAYRERVQLAQEENPNSAITRAVAAQAVKIFEETLKLAKEKDLTVWYVDTCEDLAQVYLLRHDYKNVTDCLAQADRAIPVIYKIKDGNFTSIAEQDCVEIFWLMLGKIELMRGDLVFDQAIQSSAKSVSHNTLRELLRYYLLSVTYFHQYSNWSLGAHSTFRHLYDRIKLIGFDDRRYLQEEIPNIAKELKVDYQRFANFYGGAFGLTISAKEEIK